VRKPDDLLTLAEFTDKLIECAQDPELQRRSDMLEEALDALRFYVGICGNTAAMVPISSAQEAYRRATAILTKAGRTPQEAPNDR
jgi:hypothetical protein